MLQLLSASAADPDLLHEKRFLKLLNGNEVLISYHSPSMDSNAKIRIFIRNQRKVLWDKTYVNEYDEVWYQANFIPVVKDKFIEDLNNDGFPEIGIANWNGGKAPCASSAIIFTLKENSLYFLKKQQVNTEFSRYVFRTKDDFKNSKYNASTCSVRGGNDY